MKIIVQVTDAVTGDVITEREFPCRACAEEAVSELADILVKRGYKLIKKTDEEWLFQKGKSYISVLIFDVIKA